MVHRTPDSPNGRNVDPDAPTAQHDLTQPLVPQPGDYDPAGPNGLHRHDGESADFHRRGDEPHYHDPASGIVVFFDPPASDRAGAGWFDAAVSGENQPTADLLPAAATDAAAAPGAVGSSGRDGHAGTGRPLPPRAPNGEFRPRAWADLPPLEVDPDDLPDFDTYLDEFWTRQAERLEHLAVSVDIVNADGDNHQAFLDDGFELVERLDEQMAFAAAVDQPGLPIFAAAATATAYRQAVATGLFPEPAQIEGGGS
jgi:hypothetical protein